MKNSNEIKKQEEKSVENAKKERLIPIKTIIFASLFFIAATLLFISIILTR